MLLCGLLPPPLPRTLTIKLIKTNFSNGSVEKLPFASHQPQQPPLCWVTSCVAPSLTITPPGKAEKLCSNARVCREVRNRNKKSLWGICVLLKEEKKRRIKTKTPGNLKENDKNTPSLPGIQPWMPPYSHHWMAFSHHLSLYDWTIQCSINSSCLFCCCYSPTGCNAEVGGEKVLGSFFSPSWVAPGFKICRSHLQDIKGLGVLQTPPGRVQFTSNKKC